MAERSEVSKDVVMGLAKAAELPLSEDRIALLAPQLDVLVSAANELNRRMSRHWELAPTVQFTHGDKGEEWGR
jgi:hypothetical protein